MARKTPGSNVAADSLSAALGRWVTAANQIDFIATERRVSGSQAALEWISSLRADIAAVALEALAQGDPASIPADAVTWLETTFGPAARWTSATRWRIDRFLAAAAAQEEIRAQWSDAAVDVLRGRVLGPDAAHVRALEVAPQDVCAWIDSAQHAIDVPAMLVGTDVRDALPRLQRFARDLAAVEAATHAVGVPVPLAGAPAGPGASSPRTAPATTGPLMTVKEFAAFLKTSVSTVRRHLIAGMPSLKGPRKNGRIRIDVTAAKAWMTANAQHSEGVHAEHDTQIPGPRSEIRAGGTVIRFGPRRNR